MKLVQKANQYLMPASKSTSFKEKEKEKETSLKP